jgi:hypothetical protein
MKYKDKGTMRSYAKQQEKYDLDKSDRTKRREREREYKRFVSNFYKYVERDWWDSVDDSDKKSLYSEWSHICVISHHKQDFEEWANRVKKDIKPNTSIYRNKILDKILE